MFDFLTAVMAGWMNPRENAASEEAPKALARKPPRAPASPFQIVTIANLSAQR